MNNQSCKSCGKFVSKTKTWGDCLHAYIPIKLEGKQHKDNGKTCPMFRVREPQDTRTKHGRIATRVYEMNNRPIAWRITWEAHADGSPAGFKDEPVRHVARGILMMRRACGYVATIRPIWR